MISQENDSPVLNSVLASMYCISQFFFVFFYFFFSKWENMPAYCVICHFKVKLPKLNSKDM
jgi:hypothetical protein